jgi:putative transposase
VLGGQKVQIRRPGVRADGEELNLPKFQAFADTDPLNRRVVEQMFGRRCDAPVRSDLESIGAEIQTRGTGIVAKTAARCTRGEPRRSTHSISSALDRRRCIVVSVGIDHTSRKHALNLCDGSIRRLSESVGRFPKSRPPHRPQSLGHPRWLEGAAHGGDADVWFAALIHRCHLHKLRNILEHLPDRQRSWGPRDRRPRLRTDERRDRSTAAAGSGASTRGPLPECRRQCPRSSRRDPHRPHARSVPIRRRATSAPRLIV